MKAALTQMDIVWEEKEKNKAVCERLIREAAMHQAELIIFPEMTLTGFTMNPEKYSEYGQRVSDGHKAADGYKVTDGHKVTDGAEEFFQFLSEKYNIAVLFGYIEEREKKYYNMLELTNGREILMKYAKIHPFSYGEESRHYSGGTSIAYARLHGVYMGGFICYDLRFPEIFQISSRKNELICVIANWPEDRIEHWKALLQARAIENQCYIAGVNRAGQGNSLCYPMSSMVFDPYGRRIDYKETEAGTELLYADIKAETVRQYRKEFPLKTDRNENLYRELNKNLSDFQEIFHLQSWTGMKSCS